VVGAYNDSREEAWFAMSRNKTPISLPITSLPAAFYLEKIHKKDFSLCEPMPPSTKLR